MWLWTRLCQLVGIGEVRTARISEVLGVDGLKDVEKKLPHTHVDNTINATKLLH